MRLPAFIVASLSVTLLACSGSNSGSPGGTDGGAPTFTEVYTQVISQKCLACHVPGQIGVSEGMLDMSTQANAYTNLFEAAAAGSACAGQGTRVIAGQPATSLLFEKVSMATPPCGQRMPLSMPALPQSEINEIQDWIAAGAHND
jgi:hypothetical protein